MPFDVRFAIREDVKREGATRNAEAGTLTFHVSRFYTMAGEFFPEFRSPIGQEARNDAAEEELREAEADERVRREQRQPQHQRDRAKGPHRRLAHPQPRRDRPDEQPADEVADQVEQALQDELQAHRQRTPEQHLTDEPAQHQFDADKRGHAQEHPLVRKRAFFHSGGGGRRGAG